MPPRTEVCLGGSAKPAHPSPHQEVTDEGTGDAAPLGSQRTCRQTRKGCGAAGLGALPSKGQSGGLCCRHSAGQGGSPEEGTWADTEIDVNIYSPSLDGRICEFWVFSYTSFLICIPKNILGYF